MFIRCNLHLFAQWSYVYAWSADTVQAQQAYKFWHDKRGSKLELKAMSTPCDDDRYVIFE